MRLPRLVRTTPFRLTLLFLALFIRLLRIGGNGNGNSFRDHLAAPGFRPGKPVFGRRVRRAAHERDDQQIMHRLIFGEIDMYPQAVPGQQIGHIRDPQLLAGAGDVNFHFRPGQIKSVVGFRDRWANHCQRAGQQSQHIGEQAGVK